MINHASELLKRSSLFEQQKKEFNKKEQTLSMLKTDIIEANAVVQCVDTILQDRQNKVVKHINDFVTTVLQNFGFNDLYFKLAFEEAGSSIRLRYYIIQDGNEILLEDSVGGGVIDIISFTLRLYVLFLTKKRKLLVLDEPFKHLSNEYQQRMSDVFDILVNKYEMQFIMVTHNKQLIESDLGNCVVVK